jgi:hypothetical protein
MCGTAKKKSQTNESMILDDNVKTTLDSVMVAFDIERVCRPGKYP